MRGHVALQLRAVREGVGAQRARDALLVLLVAVLDVLLEGGQPLVAPVAVGAGQQLREGVRCAGREVCGAGTKGNTSREASGLACPGRYEVKGYG